MSLIKRNGFPNLSPIFSNFFDTDYFGKDFLKNENLPAVNIKENENNFEIELAAPGLKKEDFKISIDNGVLSIASEKKEEKKEENDKFTRHEFSYASFQRTFGLPENVDEDKIEAKYDTGILKLTLAKKAIAKNTAQKEISIV